MKIVNTSILFVVGALLTACSADIETINLATVPDIPNNMLHEQKSIQKELESDRKEILKDLNTQENL